MKRCKVLSVLLMAVLITCMLTPKVKAATKLNKTKATVYVGESLKLHVVGTNKTAKWSSSNSKIATVSKSGKVTAKYVGDVIITAKIGSRKYKCKVVCDVKPTKLTSADIVDALFDYDMPIGDKYTHENDSKHMVYSTYTDFEDTTLDQSGSFLRNGGCVHVCWDTDSALSYLSNLQIAGETKYYVRFGNVVLTLSEDMSNKQIKDYTDSIFKILTE